MEKNFNTNKNINLSSVLNGASIVGCNNEHFGRAENIIAPGKGKNMGDGWETRRSRGKKLVQKQFELLDNILDELDITKTKAHYVARNQMR